MIPTKNIDAALKTSDTMLDEVQSILWLLDCDMIYVGCRNAYTLSILSIASDDHSYISLPQRQRAN